jgi:hypothetical protein
MAAIRDRDTLVLRRPDRRSPAQLAELIRRELAPTRRPLTPTFADVRLSPADRRLASFGERYPGAVARAHAGVLWAVAHGQAGTLGRAGRYPDGWDLARAYAEHRGLPALRVDRLGRLLLGDPCPRCQVALGWRPPRPKPEPKPAATPARASTSPSHHRRRPRGPADLAAATRDGLTAAAVPWLSPAQAAVNVAALRRMDIDPDRYPHLTRPRP